MLGRDAIKTVISKLKLSLTFADDLALNAKYMKVVAIQVNYLREQSPKTGFHLRKLNT